MQLVTIGTKYQIVIPKEIRKKIKDLKPGSKVIMNSSDNKTINVKPMEKNWLERTRGLMKDAWKDIDTTQYLEDLRNEWNRKI